ncbi:hypothetical protein ABT298_00465 [Streptomyces sp. NPDC001034]|uniref:hypothetical protein n=1 Tax=Streptomyces sp. NPDC001034 TaxID=3154375 RepID=UPI0033246E18
MADAVAETEGGAPGRELADVLLPDHLDAGRVLVGDAGPLQFLVELRRVGGEGAQRDVDITGSERRLPVGRRALAQVADR